MQINAYQEDLMNFPENKVIAAITWARRNLTKFPSIADLRLYIEGSDEDHANKAWRALGLMISKGEASSITLHDIVLYKTIQDTWSTIQQVRIDFARPMDQYARDSMKRDFKLAYINNYRERDHLSREIKSPVVFHIIPVPQRKNDTYELIDYMVDHDYNIVETARHTIDALPRGNGMTAEQKEEFDKMFSKFDPKPLQIAKDDQDYNNLVRRSAALRRRYSELNIRRDHSYIEDAEDLKGQDETISLSKYQPESIKSEGCACGKFSDKSCQCSAETSHE